MFYRAPLRLYDDRRDRRMGELIATVCVLSACDLVFTLWAHRFTAFHELNPLARMLLQGGMTAALVGFKLGLTMLGALIFWRLRHRVHAEIGIWGVLVVYVLLTLRWASYTQAAM